MIRSRIENTVAYMLLASKNLDHALAVTLFEEKNVSGGLCLAQMVAVAYSNGSS